METKTIFKKIASSLNRFKPSSDSCQIELQKDGVNVIAGKTDMIYGYMLDHIHEVTKSYNCYYYVSTNMGKLMVRIYIPNNEY